MIPLRSFFFVSIYPCIPRFRHGSVETAAGYSDSVRAHVDRADIHQYKYIVLDIGLSTSATLTLVHTHSFVSMIFIRPGGVLGYSWAIHELGGLFHETHPIMKCILTLYILHNIGEWAEEVID